MSVPGGSSRQERLSREEEAEKEKVKGFCRMGGGRNVCREKKRRRRKK